ncbi:rotamase/peptidyl-prolyl cis-trans isomerase family protein [Stenotrophomonas acidaminiphila]|uniref:peptidylprolyl isomerase n=1 Tax=Stenotrophomonas acidaminiphila TaxID=128780 RepID=A0A0S1B4Q6_9GAMM|nr:peptidylprolyl isomerase [Stenotrophomonas acidaminiphila]ALJ29958.1 rotamase/peptidyl-prolyl cis-trans isomerase family protein [Stenotrophomonas acidaminiphila]
MNVQTRILPITVIDSAQPVPAEAGHHHDADAEGPRSLGQPAPCRLFVDDTAISEADIAREMQHHRAMRPEQSRADAARALVVRELLRREARRLGLQAPAGGTVSDEEALIQRLLEQGVEDRVPDEDACRRYFEQNPERFRAPDRVHVRHILLAAPADDVAGRLAARSEAERLLAQLKDHPHLFADFALRHSRCPSASDGGDLGWLQRGQTTPEFDRQVFRLREGLAGFPVESRWGYHVVRVEACAPGQPQAFEVVHRQIRDYLELQVRQREIQAYLLQLQERYPVRGLEEIEAEAG